MNSTNTYSSPGAAERDPFEGLEDELPADAAFTRKELLGKAKRGFVRIRKDFVQRDTKPRPSVLAELVTGRKERALDMLLSVHALQPILEGSPLHIRTWARLLGDNVTERAAHSALKVLEDMDLLELGGKRGTPEITLKRMNGDGTPWTKREDDDQRGRGFFALPFDYWTQNTIDTLTLPGKAMLLVILRDTNDPNGNQTFVMAHERAQEFYGFSERTAERGYTELRRAQLLREHRRLVPDARHPLGKREEWHRALVKPYSTDHRDALRVAARAAAAARDTSDGTS